MKIGSNFYFVKLSETFQNVLVEYFAKGPKSPDMGEKVTPLKPNFSGLLCKFQKHILDFLMS